MTIKIETTKDLIKIKTEDLMIEIMMEEENMTTSKEKVSMKEINNIEKAVIIMKIEKDLNMNQETRGNPTKVMETTKEKEDPKMIWNSKILEINTPKKKTIKIRTH